MNQAPTSVAPGFVELHGGGTSVRIIPALGGRIAAMTIGGRQWLWAGRAGSSASPDEAARADGASYAERADAGGFDECFPTVDPCTLPDEAGAYAGLALPDHGELWSAHPVVDVRTDETEGHAASLTWRGRRMPYRFEREVRVTPAGEVVMRYAATNGGSSPIPFLWSAHPLLPLGPRTRLDLPAGTRVRVAAQDGIDLGGPGAEHRWPMLPAGKKQKAADFSVPAGVARRYACKLFLDAPAGGAAVVEDGARLEALFDAAQVPTVGLWISRRRWTPFARGRASSTLALQPSIGAPDSLAEALTPRWNGAHWLQPGETREWRVTWRGSSTRT